MYLFHKYFLSVCTMSDNDLKAKGYRSGQNKALVHTEFIIQ